MPATASQPLSKRVLFRRRAGRTFPIDVFTKHGLVQSALRLLAPPISNSMAKSASVSLNDPERWLTYQCFPKSRLKRFGLRCSCDLGTPDPTFGALVGAVCARPCIGVGTETCN